MLHRIKNNKTLATSYFSIVNMYNIIQLFIIKLFNINLNNYQPIDTIQMSNESQINTKMFSYGKDLQ